MNTLCLFSRNIESVIFAIFHSKTHRFRSNPPQETVAFNYEQASYETIAPFDLSVFGPFTRAPLGYVVHARSGDKGSDANVGFFVRHSDEWDWLRSVLSVDKIRALLGKDDVGGKIFRFELPYIWGKFLSSWPIDY